MSAPGRGSLNHLSGAIVDRDRRKAGVPFAQILLERGGKSDSRVQAGAVKVSPRQKDHRHRSVRRGDPRLAAVVGRRIVSAVQMIGGGQLIRSFGRNFRWDLLKIRVEPGVSSL